MEHGRVLMLESGQGVAGVSLATGALLLRSGPVNLPGGDSQWRVLDRSPISVRIVSGQGAGRVELRYEIDGRRLSCERRVAGGAREAVDLGVWADGPMA